MLVRVSASDCSWGQATSGSGCRLDAHGFYATSMAVLANDATSSLGSELKNIGSSNATFFVAAAVFAAACNGIYASDLCVIEMLAICASTRVGSRRCVLHLIVEGAVA